MKFDIISIFPGFFTAPLAHGVLRVAQEKKIIHVTITDPREFAEDGIVDDYQFGGGGGMVMKAEPIYHAIKHVRTKHSHLISLTPKGEPLTQNFVNQLLHKKQLVILCGRYKGVDDRIHDLFDFQEISIGDYVLSGGEIGALVLIDAITRLLPGVLGNIDSAESDSFQSRLLAPPHYTRPEVHRKQAVPHVLRSGNHKLVAHWRRKLSLRDTLIRRPDILGRETFSKNDLAILLEVLDDKNS
jgi:tRNA (guanine37-N1)-methyltransferase